jgi:hypothetical protein
MVLSNFSKLALSAASIALIAPALWAQASGSTVLKPDDLARLFPQSVYYRGQVAPAQLRNSGGVKFADGSYVLTSLVDTSGYSSGIAAKYQGFFITEVPLKIEGRSLVPGEYGIGFIAGDKFVVTDVGGHDVLTVNSSSDAAMPRPRPLQVLADAGGGFRLYAGRRYVRFNR